MTNKNVELAAIIKQLLSTYFQDFCVVDDIVEENNRIPCDKEQVIAALQRQVLDPVTAVLVCLAWADALVVISVTLLRRSVGLHVGLGLPVDLPWVGYFGERDSHHGGKHLGSASERVH